ncbi:hypothetical protein [Pseudomonas orientalis]|uniref:Uncharacterized protein n=1 Tax=Pseudomonas orientalis TaxID=76758 RepID=A0A1H2DVE2_9PSED|nr:hypothetical protein [Pseudomonas orientalis]KRP62125.1 hypothetical protein TU82_23370 [Pseudomonas orientalis]SDT86826.1 hypothetical protein SAMN04490197_0120 [Pseudomonas orientalis]
MQIENNQAIVIIEDLEKIRVSLAKLGASNPDNIEQLSLNLLHYFIKNEIFKKISSAHKILVESAERDELLNSQLDDFFEKITYPPLETNITASDLSEIIKQKQKI